MNAAAPIEPLPPGLAAALAHADAYPHDPGGHDPSGHDPAGRPEPVQTHLSLVFLTRERVYKLHKAVDLGFVSFASRAERNADCVREVTLNRRLAPDVYLGVAPLLERGDGGWQVGPLERDPDTLSDAHEHCVVMRRLRADADALSRLEAGTLGRAQLERLAGHLARFHRAQALGAPAPFAPDEWRARIAAPVRANFASLRTSEEVVDAERVRQLEADAEAAMVRLADAFERRRVAGRAVDGHGDLHLQHVFFESDDADPIVIDCIAFDEGLRRIDAAADLAFLPMDLAYRGRGDLAAATLASYARESDDFDLYAVVDFFLHYRAAVRAKVAAIAAGDPQIEPDQRARALESARSHLEHAAAALAPRPPGRLVLSGGVIGTGKSTAAGVLAEAIDGVVIASDRVRKQRAGLAPSDRPSAEHAEALYTPEAKADVYAAVLERARPVLASGRHAILDATFGRRADRDAARALARELGARCVMVETRCERAVALERLRRRAQIGMDASDAGPELYDELAAAFEPVDPGEGECWSVDTGGEGWRETLAARAKAAGA